MHRLLNPHGVNIYQSMKQWQKCCDYLIFNNDLMQNRSSVIATSSAHLSFFCKHANIGAHERFLLLHHDTKLHALLHLISHTSNKILGRLLIVWDASFSLFYSVINLKHHQSYFLTTFLAGYIWSSDWTLSSSLLILLLFRPTKACTEPWRWCLN